MVSINPMSRIEGHLDIKTKVHKGLITKAWSSGTLFRGIESILKGRDPSEAPPLTQRICGVCPVSHALASTLCLERALNLSDRIPGNARIIRNLILGANFIQSHVLHFYHFAVLDYVDIRAVAAYPGNDPDLKSVKRFLDRGVLAPFAPRYEGDYRLTKEANIRAIKHYIEAFDIRRKAHEMLAIFGGKAPHQCGIVPGGVSVKPTMDKKVDVYNRLREIREFIDDVYLPDVIHITKCYTDYFEKKHGGGCGYFLSYGAFDLMDGASETNGEKRLMQRGLTDRSLACEALDISKITESVKHAWYKEKKNHSTFVDSGKTPTPGSDGGTTPDPDKPGAYSFIKSPRYNGRAAEVGPLADVLVNLAANHEPTRKIVSEVFEKLGMDRRDGRHVVRRLISVMGRNIARAIESKLVAEAMTDWIDALTPGEPFYTPPETPRKYEDGAFFGLTGAPRGALGHWMTIQNGAIAHYQCISPTTWNASPRDNHGVSGPMEQALEGLPVRDGSNPFEIARAVRAFDPCLACAVHVFDPGEAITGERRVL